MILFRWYSADNDNAPFTDNTADGTATYAGSPLEKRFQRTGGSGFNVCGDYHTDGFAAAAGLRFYTLAKVSSISNTDVYIAGVSRNSASSNLNSRTFYISNSTIYVQMGGGSGVNALAGNDPSPISADEEFMFEQRVRSGGGSDFYIDGLEVLSNPGTEGLDYETGTLRPYYNHSRVDNSDGYGAVLERYVTDSGGFLPPPPIDEDATQTGDDEITVTWDDDDVTATNADYISVEEQVDGGGYSEVDQIDVGIQEYIGTGLAAGDYDYRMRSAVVAGGTTYYSDYTGVATVTISAPPSGDSTGEAMPVASRAAAVKRGMLRNRGGR